MRRNDLRSSTLPFKTSTYDSHIRVCLLIFWIFSFSALLQSCHKNITGPNTGDGLSNAYDTSKYMTGVHGELLLKSHFHVIADGYKLLIQGGHIYKAEKSSGKIVEDFGEYHPSPNSAGPTKTGNRQKTMGTTGTFNHTYGTSYGWVAATQYYNNSSSPINYFSTICAIPPAPTTQNDQTFGFWIGLSNFGYANNTNLNGVIQPILSYGLKDVWNQTTNNWSGGNEYQVFNVMFWSQNGEGNEVTTGAATVTPPTITNVEFQIIGEGQTNGSYDYQAHVVNPANGDDLCPYLTVTVGNMVANGTSEGQTEIPTENTPFNYAYIVLEDNNNNEIVGRSDYPNTLYAQSFVGMNNIVIATGTQPGVYTYPASIPWSVMTNLSPGPQNNESAVIVNDNNNNTLIPGQVNLWFGPLPPAPGITGVTTFSSTHTTGSGTITADPGQTVTVTLTNHDVGGFELFDIGLTGGTTFIYGGGGQR
jgi:hypothetical protein